jgi:hypothetical protein
MGVLSCARQVWRSENTPEVPRPSEAMELGNLLAASCVLIRPQLTPEDNYRAHQFYTRCLIREEELLCTGLSHRQVHA